MSSVNQAQKGLLNPIQNMDIETLEWIKNNRPSLKKTKPLKSIPVRKQLQKYLPSIAWFLRTESVDSIHGIRHIGRVMINVANLTINRKINPVIVRNCLIAASLHDLRRRNDKGDVGHAKRAKIWFIDNHHGVSKYFRVNFSDKDLKKISAAILFHEISYEEIGSKKEYRLHKEIVDLLKTADALDRYRLPRLKWWINDTFLKIIPTDNEKAFAYDLVLKSEQLYLAINDSIKSVLNLLA